MSKRKKSTPQLYDHNAAAVAHRNLAISSNGRRVRTMTNMLDVVQPSVDPYIPSLGSHESVPYAFDDEHIPLDNTNADSISGVNIKISERAKRYQNSVSP